MTEETGGAGTTPQTRTQVLKTAKERSALALKLRAARASYDEIARECGYANKSAAYKAVQRELRSIPFDGVQELRQQELESLDQLERAVYSKALLGNLGAIDRVVRLKEHRAKLTGLYEDVVDTGVAEVSMVLSAWFGKVTAAVQQGGGDDEEEQEHGAEGVSQRDPEQGG